MTRKRYTERIMWILRIALLVVLLCCAGAWYVATVVTMPGKSADVKASQLELTPEEEETAARLASYEKVLAGYIGERNTPESLGRSVSYIETQLRMAGLKVTQQPYTISSGTYINVEGELRGTLTPDKIVIVCAHYDTVPGSPGADDNGSGVAAVLELARLMARERPKCTVRFVLFGTEEPPNFRTEGMGSCFYAARCHWRNENIAGVIVLETLAYYTDAPKSQSYPVGFDLVLPSVGNFIAFVSNSQSRPLLETCVSTFRTTTQFPSEGVAPPDAVPGVDWSDQLWFWKFGVPAVMVTDTALYRNPNYHKATDTPDTLNYPALARVTRGVQKIVEKLAN